MKIVRNEVLISSGDFIDSLRHREIMVQIQDAIHKVVWPTNSDRFSVCPLRKGNGVKPIKYLFQQYLRSMNWQLEVKLAFSSAERPGPIDAVCVTSDQKLFAVEWETGNISSSHRSLNKLALGIRRGLLDGGVLILPTRAFYTYLTDRVGNYEELSPYFDIWRSIECKAGFLSVIAIEHDQVDETVPLIPKGTDGRARV
jgi:hypothetical protein